MKNISLTIQCLIFTTLTLCLHAETHKPGNLIFLHPDGTGLGHWNICRLVTVGPDGMTHWDQLEQIATYRPHQKGWLSTTSHAGATTHAYGKKVHPDSYGLDRDQPLTAVSGKPLTLMEEAMQAGIRVGIVNTGHIGEPGTGVFLARNKSRKDIQGIATSIMESGADLIFCGGEKYLLPTATIGKHKVEGVRTDGRNLLKEAEARGYRVIYTREELLNLPADTDKVIGIFAAEDTYNTFTEDYLKEHNLETYNPGTPSYAEMTETALNVLSNQPNKKFFLMAEEEATDNFSNRTNAYGMIDAIVRADAAVGSAIEFLKTHPDTLLLVGADSDAGHPTIYAPRGWTEDTEVPETTETGAHLDAAKGPGRRPFMTQPDSFGQRHAFAVAWPASGDGNGSAITKAQGYRSDLLPSTVDNTDLYPICYQVLFGKQPGSKE